MKRFASLILFLSACVTPVFAEPQPTLELRVKPINEMLKDAEAVGEMFGAGEQARQMADVAKAFSGKKGLEGIDPAKPFGMYAIATPAVVDGPVVLMVPVADAPAFLNLLSSRLQLKPVKGDGDIYTVEVPNVPQPVFFQFQHGYCYATIGTKTNLKEVLTPKQFFTGSTSSLAHLTLHVERIPADVRKVILGQVEFELAKEKDRLAKNEPSASKRRLAGLILDAAASGLKTLLDETRRIDLNLALDVKNDDLTADLRVTPKSGTGLADSFLKAGSRTSFVAGRIAEKHPIFGASFKAGLTDEWTKRLTPVVDDLLNELENEANADAREIVKKLLACFEPTMKAGELDAAITLAGGDSREKLQLHILSKVKKGLDIVDTFQDLAKLIPAAFVEAKFDLATVGKNKMHSMTLHENPGELERLFGTTTFWVGTSDELFSLGFEPKGETLKTGLGVTPQSKSIIELEVSAARFAVLSAEADKKAAVGSMVKSLYGSAGPVGRDTVRLSVTGGDQLTVKLTGKGKALRTFAEVDKINKK